MKNPLDIIILAEGIRFSRRLVDAPAMQKLEHLEVDPGASITSNEALEEYIRSTVSNLTTQLRPEKWAAARKAALLMQSSKSME